MAKGTRADNSEDQYAKHIVDVIAYPGDGGTLATLLTPPVDHRNNRNSLVAQ